MLVERLQEPKPELHRAALETMCTLIKSSTTSMTSVPKPLKFLMPHYSTIKGIYDLLTDDEVKVILTFYNCLYRNFAQTLFLFSE